MRYGFITALAAATVLAVSPPAAGQVSSGNGVPSGGWSAVVEELGLQTIGEARLRWFGLSIYDARLLTDRASYPGLGGDGVLALSLEYHRDIPAERILDLTREEWLRLELVDGERLESWLDRLRMLLPDVSRGDRLSALVMPDGTTVFYADERPLGSVEEAGFGERFLAIWLDPRTREPRLRERLTGEAS